MTMQKRKPRKRKKAKSASQKVASKKNPPQEAPSPSKDLFVKIHYVESIDEIEWMAEECRRRARISLVQLEELWGIDEYSYRRMFRRGAHVGGMVRMKTVFLLYKFIHHYMGLEAEKLNTVAIHKALRHQRTKLGYASFTRMYHSEPLISSLISQDTFFRYCRNPLAGSIRLLLSIAQFVNSKQFPQQ